jgi:hypothetical protein
MIVRVLACLAEVLGIRATARVFEVDANTVLQWLVETAEQLQAFTSSFLCDVHVTQLQMTMSGRCVKSCSIASRPGPNLIRGKRLVKRIRVIPGSTGLLTSRSTALQEVQQTGFKGS